MLIEVILPWRKQVGFHPININCYISTSLDFQIPRAKILKKSETALQRCS